MIYDSFADDLCRGNINLASDTFFGMLCTSTYVPSKGGDTKRSNVTNEAVGAGYTAGGQAVAITLTKDTSGHKETVAFADNSWPASSISASQEIIYKARGGLSSADELVCAIDFGGTITSSAGTFTAQATTPLTIAN